MITSIHNKRVARAVRLKKRAMREKDRLFLVEGAQGVAEALSSKARVQVIFTSAGTEERLAAVIEAAHRAGVPVHPVTAEVMAHLTSTVTPQGVVAVSEFVDLSLTDLIEHAEGILPVLVEVRDPGNAGTILRSADASGAGGVVFTSSSVDVYNQKTVRATAGSLFHLPVARDVDVVEAVAALRDRGFAILAADAEGTRSVYEADLRVPTAVLFGNESRGLSQSALASADQTIRVPISGQAESLNLAAAGTLVLFEAVRQRASAGEEAELLSRIVAGAAHDIRSPLTAMKGFTGTLLSRWERLDEEQRLAMIEGVAGDAFRMEAIIAQLLDAARMQAGTLDLAPVPTDLQTEAKTVAEDYGRWSQVEVEVVGTEAVALVDPARLRTVLIALIESAQWWGETGPVRVETSYRAVPTVVVRRAGSPLEPTARAELFRPRMPGSGSGSKVGLYVARGLTEAHGGRVEAGSTDGISFTLTLPPADRAS